MEQFDKDVTNMLISNVVSLPSTAEFRVSTLVFLTITSPTTQGVTRTDALNTLKTHPQLRKCHPTIEHLVPLHVAAGAAGDDPAKKLLDWNVSTIGWASYSFGL